jgi:hypothetical protein
MRTTLTLDDDVAALVERARKARKQSLREVVNDGLRQGLRPTAPPEPRGVYVTPEVDLGRCFLESLDDVAEALAVAEGEGFK